MNIFVSYTLRDGVLDEHKLERLHLILRGSGDPYIDVLHNKSLNRQARVVEELSNANVLIACVTQGFFASEWVQFELATARRRGIPIITLDMRPERNDEQIAMRPQTRLK